MFKGISQGKDKKQKYAFRNWRTGLYVLDVLNEQCASTKDSRERSEESAQRPECERDKGFKNEKKQKAQLLAERSVEGSSRLGLVRVSWKNVDFCCAGSAAMAPSSMLSTYVAKKDFLVTVPILCHVSHVISFTRLGLCCEVARVRSKRKIQAYGVTLHNPTPHSSNLERRFDMIRCDSWYIHAPCEPMSSCQSRSDKEHIALFQGRTAKLQTQLSVQIKSSKCVVWNGTPEMSRHHPGFGHLHSHRTW